MISRKKRSKPLYSIEEIFRMNGVNYDTSHPSDCIMLKDSDGKIYKIDSSFNIFENLHSSFYDDCTISTKSSLAKSSLKGANDIVKELDYKKDESISGKSNCDYQTKSEYLFNKDMIFCTAA